MGEGPGGLEGLRGAPVHCQDMDIGREGERGRGREMWKGRELEKERGRERERERGRKR